MSIKDNASIALIPSGYKSLKVYSVIPDDGNGDFTFSRGSNATRVAASGLLETVPSGVPRLDYPLVNGVVQTCPALLLEPSTINRTNYSTQIDNGYWGKSNSSVSANNSTSPNGALEADKLVENTATSSHGISKSIAITSSTTSTFSLFAKAAGRNTLRVQFSSGVRAFFNVSNGTIGTVNFGTTAKIEKFPNDWYRCSITGTSSSGSTTFTQVLMTLDNQSTTYTGNGSSGVLLWGLQFETTSFATSFIETITTTSSRSVESAFGSGTTTEINSPEGTLFVEIAALSNNNPQHRRITLSNGTTSNVVRIAYDTGSQRITCVLFNGSNQCVFQATSSNSSITDVVDFNKVALSYKANEFKCFINGTQFSSTDTLGTTFAADTLNELAFDNGGGGNRFEGKVKQAMLSKTALTDSELQALTS